MKIAKIHAQEILDSRGNPTIETTIDLDNGSRVSSSVPSGAIAAVLASRYGCDSSLAGWMVVGTYLVSLITIPFLFTVLLA